jgi:hypothetical protein
MATETKPTRATSSTAKPETSKPPTANTEVQIPKLESHPEFAKAAANLQRLLDEERQIELDLSDNQRQRLLDEKDKDRRAKALLRGDDPNAGGPLLRRRDDLVRRSRDLARAIALARGDLATAAQVAREAIGRPLVPVYRELIRRVAYAMVAACRSYDALESMHDELFQAGLNGGIFDQPLPRHPWGRLDDPQSMVNSVLGTLIDRGYLSVKDDAELLRGAKPVGSQHPIQAAPAAPKKPVTWREALTDLGLSAREINFFLR